MTARCENEERSMTGSKERDMTENARMELEEAIVIGRYPTSSSGGPLHLHLHLAAYCRHRTFTTSGVLGKLGTWSASQSMTTLTLIK